MLFVAAAAWKITRTVSRLVGSRGRSTGVARPRPGGRESWRSACRTCAWRALLVENERTPGDLRLPGFAGVGRALRPSDVGVEEHSGRERGLVHLAHAGEAVRSGFHDGCHYPA